MGETRRDRRIRSLISSRKKLELFLYTPFLDIPGEIRKRQNDKKLAKFLVNNYEEVFPKILKTGKHMALARHIASPTYEVIRFLQCADVMKEMNPVILEYTNDKYVNINLIKQALAELKFFQRRDEHDKTVLTKRSIINRNKSSGERLNVIKTKTGVSFVDFHHKFFRKSLPNSNITFVDLSSMYKKLGGYARTYYKAHLALFLKNTVLFENYLLNKEEIPFLEKVILPAMLELIEETGYKPLIVNLGPTGNEDDVFWISYPSSSEKYVEKLMIKRP